HELQRPHAGADRDDRRRSGCSGLRRWRSGGRSGGSTMAVGTRGTRRHGGRKKEDKAAHGQKAESLLRLEGNVFVGDALLGVVVGRCSGRGTAIAVGGVAAGGALRRAGSGAFAATAEELEVVD